MSVNQEILQQKLTIILQRCLVEVRNLAMGRRHRQIHDLADAVEMLPPLLAHCDERHLGLVRNALTSYQTKYGAKAYDYLCIPDMDEAAFREVYLSPKRDWERGEGQGKKEKASVA